MAHFDYIKPGGVWGMFSLFTSAIAANIDARIYKTINGDEGGTWAPSAQIIIGGAGLKVVGPFQATDADITITTGKYLRLNAGSHVLGVSGSDAFIAGTWTYVGTVNVQGGGTVRVSSISGIHMLNGGTAVWDSGSTAQFESGSYAWFKSGAWLTINPGASLYLSGGMLVSDAGAGGTAGRITFGSIFGPGKMLVTQYGNVEFESGSTLDFRGGATLNFSPTGPFSTITGRAVWTGAGPVFRDYAEVHGTFRLISTGVLTFDDGSTITGKALVTNGATIEWQDGSHLNLRAGARETKEIGSIVVDGSTTTRTGPTVRTESEVMVGDAAYTAIRRPKMGPLKNTTGQSYVDVDLTPAEIWTVGVLTDNPVVWRLSAPPDNTPLIRYIRQEDATVQGNPLLLVDNNGLQFATMFNVGGGGYHDGTLIVFFDGTKWRNLLPYPYATGKVYTDVW